ncbi:MAG: rRNA maturation RNase YbeY [Acholeplasmatales bacterium]|nr:rRNA maturation RNase YbeY [Acholeplasmatales bacterium]
MKINFINETKEVVTDYKKLIRDIFKFDKSKTIMNIIFVTDEEIQRINREYRNIDRITDVISFALNDEKEFLIKTEELGDIFICLDQAKRQANEYNHSLDREIGFLSVHGYLHLHGYDHQTKEDEEVMFKKQDEILNNANLRRG